MDNIKWIARVGQSKYNRGSGVGYRLGKSGQRLYVAYTASTTMHRVSKAAALIGILCGYIDSRNHRNRRRMFARPVDERGIELRNVLDRVLQ